MAYQLLWLNVVLFLFIFLLLGTVLICVFWFFSEQSDVVCESCRLCRSTVEDDLWWQQRSHSDSPLRSISLTCSALLDHFLDLALGSCCCWYLARSPPVRLLVCDRSWSRLSVPELLGLLRLSDSPLGCFGSGRKANRLSASLNRLSPPDADDAGEELGGSGEEEGPSPGQQRQRLPRRSGEQRQEELVR